MAWTLLGGLGAMAPMPNLPALVPDGAVPGGMLEFDGSCSSWFLNLPCRQSQIRISESLVLCPHLTSSPGREEDALLLHILEYSTLVSAIRV